MKLATLTVRPEPSADAALAARAAQGDERAFEQIMRAHNRLLYRTARSILRDDAEAEDVLQDAYVKAYCALKNFRGESKLSTWLARVVINEALGRLRKASPEQVDVDNVVHLEQHIERTAHAPLPSTPEELAMSDELRQMIQAHVDRLPAHFRTVFVLRAIEELSVEETAQCLGLAQITVRTRFLRARRLLREHAARELRNAFDAAFAFASARCDGMVAGVLARIRALPPPTA